MQKLDIQQGTPEWLELRREYITATDAPAIMNESPFRTRRDIYNEKVLGIDTKLPTAVMKRGLELEAEARETLEQELGVKLPPCVITNGHRMASLDGLSDDGTIAVEIKCPGRKDHDLGMIGLVPKKYYAQLQHQMIVCGLEKMYYMTYNENYKNDFNYFWVYRDEEYIQKLIEKEDEFYRCVTENLPLNDENDFVFRDDDEWLTLSKNFWAIEDAFIMLEKEKEKVRRDLIQLAAGKNTTGGGLNIRKVTRKGAIEYDKIPELKNVDLEKYRKVEIITWRFTK